jgi:hypothetical protein
MRNIQATGNLYGQTVTINQVSKAKAKKLFAAGKEIYLQSSNMYPFNMWQSVCPIKLDNEQLQADIRSNQFSIDLYSEQVEKFTKSNEDWSNPLIADYAKKVSEHKAKVIDANSQFEYNVINYSYYNCDNERGKYVTFYAKHEDI